jgi:hypothetical protein
MPMIEFRYAPESINDNEAQRINDGLESALRNTLQRVRPSISHEYSITVEGDPFKFKVKQPTLRIYVFYHQEWNFTPDELELLARTMGDEVNSMLTTAGMHDVPGKIRFYERTGHASSQIRAIS